MTDPPRLGERGQIFVTLAAARTYAEARRLAPEEARRELTELLLDARCNREATDSDKTAHYRARSRTTQIDLSATVIQEGRLLLVLSAHGRDYR